MCIQNTTNVTKTIGVTLELNSVMERITNVMSQNNAQGEETPTLDLLTNVGKTMREIRDQAAKMI